MRRRLKYTGSVMGLALLCAVAGGGTSFAGEKAKQAKQTKQTEAVAEVKTDSTKKKDAKTADNKSEPAAEKKDEKKEQIYYGRLKKAEQNKLLLDEAAVIWDQAAEAEAKPASDTKAGEDSGKATNASEETADYETDAMKWKLSGNTIEIALEDGTKFVKEPLEQEGAAGKKDATASKDDKSSKDAKASGAEKTGSKDGKSEPVPAERKDVTEGSMVKVTLKGDGSMTASEVMVLSGVKEAKPAEAKAENTKQKTEKK